LGVERGKGTGREGREGVGTGEAWEGGEEDKEVGKRRDGTEGEIG